VNSQTFARAGSFASQNGGLGELMRCAGAALAAARVYVFINEYCTALEQHAHGSLSTIPDVNSSRAQSVTVTLHTAGQRNC